MKTRILVLALTLVVCLCALPAAASASAPSKSGGITLSEDRSHYVYSLPQSPPAHDYYREAFSTSHEFRDIFIEQYGTDKAIVYDMVAHVMLAVLYDDGIAYATDVRVYGFEQLADVGEMSAARLAVGKDMPFLETFVFFRGGGSGRAYECVLTRELTNYFSDDAPTDNPSYIRTRDRVIAELEDYRAAVAGVADDEERLEIAGQLFDDGSVYDKDAPYHAVAALLTGRGICGSANWAFTLVGNAVGVPSYHLHVTGITHAATLVKPNGGALKVIDVTFGKRNPRVEAISSWKHRDQLTWNSDAVGFKNDYYFPDVDILARLGGLS